jgi:tetratricopeptide (TPR) repeat protein
MSSDERWQWVDEDPIEKLLRPPAGAIPSTTPSESSAARYRAAGYAQFEGLRFEEAVGSYAAAVAAEPGHGTAHFDLAVCLEKTEQWKAAANAFRRALEDNPGHAEALAGLGACLLHLGAAEEALSCFERLVETNGPNEAATLGKAVALQKLTRYEEADRIYRDMLQTNPDAVEPLANLIALSGARQDAAAVSEYSHRLLRIHPQSKAALQGLAMLAIRNGDQAAAVEYCLRLVEADPDSFEGWFNLRFAQQRMQPHGKAARSIA